MMAMGKQYEYRRGEPFLEKAVDILHKICKEEPRFAWCYEGGRWGKARLRKLLLGLDCYESVKITGDPLELVRYCFLKNIFDLPDGVRDRMHHRLFVKGRCSP